MKSVLVDILLVLIHIFSSDNAADNCRRGECLRLPKSIIRLDLTYLFRSFLGQLAVGRLQQGLPFFASSPAKVRSGNRR